MPTVLRSLVVLALTCAVAACSGPPGDRATATADLLPGFAAVDVISGLNGPTATRFGPTDRLWIAEQEGRVKVFETVSSTSPLLTADLSDHVFGRNNRGLLGLAPDPLDDASAYILYTYPAPVGAATPVWNDDATNCPDGTTRSCVSTGVLARLSFTADGAATETVLARGWCHHHGSHVPDDLRFGPDGALYASAGEGSVPELALDDGTWLSDEQRCNGGAFASRMTPEQRGPGEWNGAVARFDAEDLDAVARGEQSAEWLGDRGRVVAYGLRNPFRMTFRPGTPELWIGDPGWYTWEEIDVVPDATNDDADDFGWPCREGPAAAQGYDADPRCSSLNAAPSDAVEPWLAQRRGEPVDAADSCPTAPTAISSIGFGPASWAAPYGDALYFGDYSRGCLYVARTGTDGLPDPTQVSVFWPQAGTPVDITSGPDGALYVTRIAEGVITRISRP